MEFPAMKGEVLGIQAYRGFATLADISRISDADVFDQKENPKGTQRDLSISHARQAYDYVAESKHAFWPEVVLCCRHPEVLRFVVKNKQIEAGMLKISFNKIQQLRKRKKIAISRLDGNHRLYFAAGSGDEFLPLEQVASFCILIGLSRNDEISLFRDINNNQRRMNTSHLDSIDTRLTPKERLIRTNPALYISKKLGDDEESPFFGKIFVGGKKERGFYVPLRTMKSGLEYLKQKSSKIEQLKDIEAEYLFIRNYWHAVEKWVPEAWESPKDFLLLRGAGLWGACILGGVVIDKCLDKGLYSISDMLTILKSGKTWDWGREGDFKGYSGRGGATQIANKISAEFSTEGGVSIKRLADKIKSK